jgi:hypothetical protein
MQEEEERNFLWAKNNIALRKGEGDKTLRKRD